MAYFKVGLYVLRASQAGALSETYLTRSMTAGQDI
jgi:hypothetical protein